MAGIEEMSLDEIEAAMARLRDQRRKLKKTGKVAERKIATLMRRRARFMTRVDEIDAQIEVLNQEISLVPAPQQPRRRGRRPKSEQIAI